MKIVAAVFADFEEAPLGGPSRLGDELHGRPILHHTLARLARVAGIDACCLFVRPRDREAAARALGSAGLEREIELLPIDDGQRRRRALLTTARKWNPPAWRGTPLCTTWYDEFVEPLAVARLIEHYHCHAVLCVEGHQAVLDPEIASAQVAHLRAHAEETSYVFSPGPPGIGGLLLGTETLRMLLEQDLPVGLLLGYRPEMPRQDPVNQPPCYHIDPDITHTQARLLADNRRSVELLESALRELGPDAGAADLCAWFRQPGHDPAGPLPIEVEIELTTDHPLPNSGLRPPRDRIPLRQLTDLDALSRLADQLADYEDRRVVLGGLGDPLSHPAFSEACRRLRRGGIRTLGLVTPLVNLTDEALETLFSPGIDLVQVRLDADSPETYRRVHGSDAYERVLANMERIQAGRQARISAHPIICPSITRCALTIDEMEAFYDRWIKATGWAVIDGYNDYAGVLPPDELLSTEPPIRGPCRRIERRLVLLADGRTLPCLQDIDGRYSLGSWLSKPLTAMWVGQDLESLRQAHRSQDLEPYPLCRRCHAWYRP